MSVLCAIGPERAAEGVQALAGAAASTYEDFELVVLVHASNRKTVAAAKRVVAKHPAVPAVLFGGRDGYGLGQVRNLLTARARGEYVLMLDASGGIYPSTLGRLASALDADPAAAFSYPMVAAYEGDEPVELLSSLPWEPERLRTGNWIDGAALIRRERLLEHGGYTTDPRLAGWEDFHLWCLFAAAGEHGAHVPQVLAWRRRRPDPATPEKWALMHELFPGLLAEQGGRSAPR